LEALLRGVPGLELTGVFADAAAIADTPADVVVLAPGDRQLLPELGAPVVLVGEDSTLSSDALAAGVSAVLPLDAGQSELVAAIYDAAIPVAASGSAALSPREIEVLGMLARGLPNKNIAWELGISEHAVKFHVASILNRLGASSRAQAVAIGIRRGLIPV
jgi:DNA-binding NarL/FixJ family response regulator